MLRVPLLLVGRRFTCVLSPSYVAPLKLYAVALATRGLVNARSGVRR